MVYVGRIEDLKIRMCQEAPSTYCLIIMSVLLDSRLVLGMLFDTKIGEGVFILFRLTRLHVWKEM